MTRPSRPRRASAAILGCWLALLGLAAGVLPASAAPTPPSGEVSFDLTEVSPAVARPSDTLTITGTVTNSTDEAFTNPQVRIGVQRAVPDDVEELMAWFDQDDPPSARLEYQGDQRLTVEPGQSAEVTLTVPVEQIPFPIRSTTGAPEGWRYL